MKTAHELARDLLAGPNLPIFHFDPSRAGMEEERDTSLSEPCLEKNGAEVFDDEGESKVSDEFLTISGEQGEEPNSNLESEARRDIADLHLLAIRIARAKHPGDRAELLGNVRRIAGKYRVQSEVLRESASAR